MYVLYVCIFWDFTEWDFGEMLGFIPRVTGEKKFFLSARVEKESEAESSSV